MPRKPATTLPAFTPVPRLCDRSNGWKPEVQLAFIEALAETGSVKAASRRVGRSDHGAYQLRRHPEGAGFRKAWDVAADLGVRRIEDAAMDRALNGVEETVHYHGELVGKRRRYNERLVMFILRNRAPHRFAEGGPSHGLSAVDQATLKRMRKRWRKEWEAERVEREDAEDRADREACDTFVDQLDQMHRTWYANLSPRARAAYREFRRAERADLARGYIPGEDEIAEAEADYDADCPRDGRAKIKLLIEADGYGVDEVLAEACPEPGRADEPPQEPPPPGPRIRTIKGEWE
jgi:hypothetical protein